jgi:serine/threonine protein kinase
MFIFILFRMYTFVKYVERILLSLLLVYALHFEGNIHRDIKPANFFVGNENLLFCLGLFFLFKI